jgi:hypothetical protein
MKVHGALYTKRLVTCTFLYKDAKCSIQYQSVLKLKTLQIHLHELYYLMHWH